MRDSGLVHQLTSHTSDDSDDDGSDSSGSEAASAAVAAPKAALAPKAAAAPKPAAAAAAAPKPSPVAAKKTPTTVEGILASLLGPASSAPPTAGAAPKPAPKRSTRSASASVASSDDDEDDDEDDKDDEDEEDEDKADEEDEETQPPDVEDVKAAVEKLQRKLAKLAKEEAGLREELTAQRALLHKRERRSGASSGRVNAAALERFLTYSAGDLRGVRPPDAKRDARAGMGVDHAVHELEALIAASIRLGGRLPPYACIAMSTVKRSNVCSLEFKKAPGMANQVHLTLHRQIIVGTTPEGVVPVLKRLVRRLEKFDARLPHPPAAGSSSASSSSDAYSAADVAKAYEQLKADRKTGVFGKLDVDDEHAYKADYPFVARRLERDAGEPEMTDATIALLKQLAVDRVKLPGCTLESVEEDIKMRTRVHRVKDDAVTYVSLKALRCNPARSGLNMFISALCTWFLQKHASDVVVKERPQLRTALIIRAGGRVDPADDMYVQPKSTKASSKKKKHRAA